ncbi:MAG TPA: CHASE4 domain-containing protein, partial [Oculatellaceae cyanobacterium]
MIRSNVERVTEALANDLIELNSTARDWAAWDDTYSFVQDGNQSYIQTNLGDSAIANLRLNVMLFINKAGQIIYGKGLDLQQKVAAPVPDSLRQYLAANPRLLQHKVADSSYTGIVLLPEGLLLVASQPIVNSDRTSLIRGTLILGHFLNAAQVKRLSNLTHLAIAVYPFQDTRLPSDFQAAKSQLKKEASNSKTRSEPLIHVRTLSAKRIAGYTLLKDIEGQPGLLLRVDIPRDIYRQSQQGLRYLLGAILTASLIFGIVTLLLLEKSVLSPLARFSTAVRLIRASGDLSGRLLIRSRDELSRLGTAINQLLATLQQSQLQLSESEDRYRSVVNNVREVIFQTDVSGTWIFLNSAWTDITGFSIEESLGKPCWKFIHPEDQPHHSEQFHQLIEGEKQDTRYEIRYQTQGGEYRWFEVHSRVTFEVSGAKVGTAGTLNDITERKVAEVGERRKTQELEQTLQELRETQAQLIQSEKMSSLGQLVAGIAHEINNPISFVYGNIEYASQYIKDLLHLVNCYQQHYPNPPPAIQAEIAEIDLKFLM